MCIYIIYSMSEGGGDGQMMMSMMMIALMCCVSCVLVSAVFGFLWYNCNLEGLGLKCSKHKCPEGSEKNDDGKCEVNDKKVCDDTENADNEDYNGPWYAGSLFDPKTFTSAECKAYTSPPTETRTVCTTVTDCTDAVAGQEANCVPDTTTTTGLSYCEYPWKSCSTNTDCGTGSKCIDGTCGTPENPIQPSTKDYTGILQTTQLPKHKEGTTPWTEHIKIPEGKGPLCLGTDNELSKDNCTDRSKQSIITLDSNGILSRNNTTECLSVGDDLKSLQQCFGKQCGTEWVNLEDETKQCTKFSWDETGQLKVSEYERGTPPDTAYCKHNTDLCNNGIKNAYLAAQYVKGENLGGNEKLGVSDIGPIWVWKDPPTTKA